jgi:hypothetical protein
LDPVEASGLIEVQIAKYEITVPVCILEGPDNRASGIGLYSSTAEVSCFLVYHFHIKGIVLYY